MPISIFLSVLSGILLTLAYPSFNIEMLAWVAFVPLFFAIKDKSPKEAFLLSFITGIVFYAVTMYWLVHVSAVGLVLLVLYLALYFGLFGLLLKLRITNYELRITDTFIVAATWVALEYIRANAFTGFGWVLLGYSQYLNLPVIQIADITGTYGVSFLIMLVNVTVFQVFNNFKEKKLLIRAESPRRGRITNYGLLITLIAVFLVVAYGFIKLNAPLSGDKFRVSVIQGNIHQGEKWDSSLKNEIFAKYERLTLEALLDKPDLIIWPETSFPGFPEEETLFIDKLAFLSKKMRADILIGAPTFADPGGYKFYNSAILIDKDNGICMQYDKAHLVPFGEYLPFERILGFVRGFSSRPIGDFEGGDEYTVFESGSRRFGVLICFEDIFPGLVRNFTRANPDFMVNITNDAWFMRSSAPYQHAQASVLRAVENRVSFVRSANTGLSCFIDPKGRITEAVSKDEKEIFVDGFRTAEVPAGPRTSFYRRHGDIFAIGSMFLALALAVRKIII